MFCPVCDSSQVSIFFEMLDVPIFCNVLWSDQEAAKNCVKGEIRLAFCSDCGFIYNTAFDPTRLEYCPDYENSLDFSPRFQEYAQSLAKRLIQRHDLHQKKIIEIGCGKGDFLVLLCELGNNYGVGFDPSYVDHREVSNSARDRVEFVRDFYSQQYSNYQGDFICCRHTLEHIQNPRTLLNVLRSTVKDDAEIPIFFEVPNAIDTFQRMAIWDIIYEHCSYFSPVSLSYVFSKCGFKVNNFSEEFQGQFLTIEGTKNHETANLKEKQIDEINAFSKDIALFTKTFNEKLSLWQEKLKRISHQGQKVVIWGAGSKGVTFLNLIKEESSVVDYVIDINPRKNGKYIPGTGQKIRQPEFLSNYQPELIIVMNSIYQEEIKKQVFNLGLNPEFMFV